MRILIANDDGYLAPGIAALVEACHGLGHVDVFAPERNASGTSNALNLQQPLSPHTAANGLPPRLSTFALLGLGALGLVVRRRKNSHC